MKTLLSRSVNILLILSCIAFLIGPGCGQKGDDKKTVETVEPMKPEVTTPVVTTDSTPITKPVDQVNTNKTDTPKQETKVVVKKDDIKKEITPIEKKKEPEPVINHPVQPEIKPVIKPVIEPVKPPVVKEPEPIKPIQEPAPKKTEEPKTIPVVTPVADPGGWVVPAKYKTMANPYPPDKENLALGKSLYGTHCKSCHGSKGEGDGPKAAELNTKVKSFLLADFRAQKPGEVFYKTTFGRKDMPKFEKKIADEEERWAVVNYIMSLK